MRKSKFPFHRQHDATNCAHACVRMICEFHGINIGDRELGQVLTESNKGTSLLALENVLTGLGFECDSYLLSLKELQELNLPAILHWESNHYVVIYRIGGNRNQSYIIADPAKGKCRLTENDLRKHWISMHTDTEDKGVALSVTPRTTGNLENTVPRCQENSPLRFIKKYLKQYRIYLAQIVTGLIIGCLLQLIMPFLTQWIVDIGIRHSDIRLIWLILLGELMIIAGRTATDFIRRWMLLHISMRINISLVSDFFLKLLKLPMSFFDTKLMGDLLQRIGDHSRIQNFLTSQVLNILFSLLSFVIFGVVLLIYSPVIFLVFLTGSAVYGVWIISFLGRRKVLDYEYFGEQAKNQNRTYQFITSMQEIKLQDCERRRRWEWEDTQADLFAVQMKALKLQQTQEAGSIFINEVKNILITVFAATAVINGQITLGAMLAIQYIVGQLNSPVEQLMQFIYSLQDVRISLERINEIHSGRDEEPEAGMATEFAAEKSIRLDHVDFRYDRHALRKTLEGVSLNIPEGKVTAIVGASGSGKTTLVKLMLGYYPAEAGTLSVAGRDIGDYSLRWWRRQCGVVMQDGVIFSESIERNIAVGDGEVDRARLEHAARTACIHDYVMSLPLRYNTKIGRDGLGLSQGQRQRILIARAVYKDPDFIFLDEATNSLDAKNERDIVENLSEFYRGRTVVIVAHRLSTVRDADQIIVIDGGKVVETGDHASLTARKGAYYNLVKNQLELGT